MFNFWCSPDTCLRKKLFNPVLGVTGIKVHLGKLLYCILYKAVKVISKEEKKMHRLEITKLLIGHRKNAINFETKITLFLSKSSFSYEILCRAVLCAKI